MLDQNEMNWCTFDATESVSVMISNIALFAIIIVSVFEVIAYCKHRRIGTFQSSTEKVSFIFELIFLWALCICLTELINIIAYYVYIDDQTNDNSKTLLVWSMVYFFISFICPFVINTILMEIPQSWISNTLDQINFDHVKHQDRIKLDKLYKILGIFTFYRKVRIIYIVFFFGAAITNIITSQIILLQISAGILILESIITLINYLVGFWFQFKFKYILTRIIQNIREILLEYLILGLVCIIRVVNNYFTNFSNIYTVNYQKNCYNQGSEGQMIINAIFLLISIFFMHIAPICCVLYIYWPKLKKESCNQEDLSSNSMDKYLLE